MDADDESFYRLGEQFERGAFRVDWSDELPDAFAVTRAEVAPTEPLRFHRDDSGGDRRYDYIGTTWAPPHLVSDRFVGVLRDGSFTGWTTYPVEIHDRRGVEVDGYHGLAVTGRCGSIDPELSPVEVLPPAVPGGEAQPHRIGLRFRLETWDGSDVFVAEGTATTIVTSAVRDALVAAGLTNVSLERLSEIAVLVLDDEDDA